MKKYYNLLAFNVAWPGKRKEFLNKLSDATGFDKETLEKQGYFAIARHMVDSIVPDLVAQGKTITITGHSQGGATAALIAMYLAKINGTEYETVTFAAVGARCIANGFKDQLDIDHAGNFSFITNYNDPYDFIGAIDWRPGQVCYIPPPPNMHDKCKPVVGLGVELMVQPSLWTPCRRLTHTIFHYYTQLQDDSAINEDGTTPMGCRFERFDSCPVYKTDHKYGAFIFMNVLFLIVIIGVLSLAIFAGSRKIWLIRKGRRSDPVFWCKPCRTSKVSV